MKINSNILFDMYINQHMTMNEIAVRLSTYIKDIRKNIKENNIPIRKRGFGFNVKQELILSSKQYEFLDGLMLSDGSICRRNSLKGRKTQGNDFLSCAFKHKEFADYINNFLSLGSEVRLKNHISDRYKSGNCFQYSLLSKPNVFFTKERDRWYPDGKKVIPADFRFTPTSMNIAYLGDGYIKRDAKQVRLCTNAFNIEVINNLIKQFLDIGIIAKISGRNEIYMNYDNSIKFLQYIGDCPVECYKYKWNI